MPIFWPSLPILVKIWQFLSIFLCLSVLPAIFWHYFCHLLGTDHCTCLLKALVNCARYPETIIYIIQSVYYILLYTLLHSYYILYYLVYYYIILHNMYKFYVKLYCILYHICPRLATPMWLRLRLVEDNALVALTDQISSLASRWVEYW